jgi:hypothetical protein
MTLGQRRRVRHTIVGFDQMSEQGPALVLELLARQLGRVPAFDGLRVITPESLQLGLEPTALGLDFTDPFQTRPEPGLRPVQLVVEGLDLLAGGEFLRFEPFDLRLQP